VNNETYRLIKIGDFWKKFWLLQFSTVLFGFLPTSETQSTKTLFVLSRKRLGIVTVILHFHLVVIYTPLQLFAHLQLLYLSTPVSSINPIKIYVELFQKRGHFLLAIAYSRFL